MEIRGSSSLTNAEWVEVQQGLPGCNEPILRHFLASRNSLIDLEKQRRSDHHFRQTCSLISQESCDIVDRIRDEERKTIWNSVAAKTMGQKSEVAVHPGMIFSQAKKLMETTKLWKIVKQMPKGALLHAHLDAMVELDFLFDLLLSTPGVHIYCASAVTNAKELETAPIKFKFMNSSIPSIWSIGYIPNSLVPVTEAADTFPDGGRPAFLTWLRSRCSITERETLDQFNGVDDIWRKFSSIFLILDTILFYEPIFRRCIRRIFTQLNADRVSWADLRLAFNFYYYREGNEEPDTDFSPFFLLKI
ncbi:Adenosine deaminase AGSA [Erysiphe neolycopersici]|uniref:Adenosine deaminase AGSA n=1 Tax=Erysiphe neolycopersici TaxID=212602 RepID=A0A420I4J1_9PEZI|nr:Adenosine deaminase AGSA [Erysiphe neolycopersici]